MIKLLIGGSPCTFWSISQKNGRETEPEGLGWELFKNYLVAKEKFKPDFFLYENNKSAAKAIKEQIKKELNVWDGTLFMPDSGARYIEINSALVSAQNRQRFYVHNCGEVEQPQDRGILLRDILESSKTAQRPLAALLRGVAIQKNGTVEQRYEARGEKTNALTTVQKDNNVAEPVRIPEYGIVDKARPINSYYPNNCGGIEKRIWSDNPSKQQVDVIAEPALQGGYGNLEKYARPCEWDESGAPIKAISCADGKTYPVYLVEDGNIHIKGKQYPIKLIDGYWIIRKLTVKECCRLQTMPDDYCRAVSDSQAYKGLGNGWTAEVIIHILNGALKDVPRDEEIVVLSMYDGIGTGRYCLDKMGFTNVKYFAYEIDKFAKQIAMSNYPDIIQMGDAFNLRHPDWTIGY